METPEWRLWSHSGVCIINSEHGLHRVSIADFEQVNIDRDILLRPFNLILIIILTVCM